MSKTPKLLEEIRDAAAFIAGITRVITEEDYQRNRMLRQSVERNVEIIGEAIRRLTQHDPVTAHQRARADHRVSQHSHPWLRSARSQHRLAGYSARSAGAAG